MIALGLNQVFAPAMRFLLFAMFLFALARMPLEAQLVVKLSPQTVKEFEHYVTTAESSLKDRWSGKQNFMSIEDDAEAKSQVLAGTLLVQRVGGSAPIEITDGLIHDWVGTVYMPNTTLDRVLKVLQDFDHHKDIYPEVADSKLISRHGNELTGYWRLQQKGVVPAVFNVQQDVSYQQVAPGKWKCQAYARNITEIDMSLFTRGRKFPLGQGHGYLWRLYAYWSLESYGTGVLAECRTVSLSRDIPPVLSWAISPYVDKMPQDSLTSTLKHTRDAAASDKPYLPSGSFGGA